MTDHHPDDEALSAVLDGEATADEAAHVDGCAVCGARLAALRDASLPVRAPVPPAPDHQRDAAIAAALVAMPATVVPLRRRRSVPQWLGAAALIAVVAGTFGLLAQSGDDDDAGDDAATAAGGGATTLAPAQEEAGADVASGTSELFATPAPVVADDLGEIAGIDLRTIVASRMAARESADADDADGAADGDRGEAAVPAPPACEEAVRATNPDAGTLVFQGTGTRDGEPVAVLAFDGTDEQGEVRRTAYVLTVECDVTLQETFAP